MNLHSENPSPDTSTIADVSFNANGSSTAVASTNIAAAHPQDPAFLRLPPELRFMICDYVLNFACLIPRPLSCVPDEKPDHLKAMARLSGICRQIRFEMHALLANKMLLIELAATRGRNVLPYSALHKRPKAYKIGSRGQKDSNLNAPRTFKFWKVMFIAFSNTFPGLFIATIDLKKRKVINLDARRAQAASSHSAIAPFPQEQRGVVSPEAIQMSRESLAKSVQAVVEREDFDGISFGDTRLLLHSLKVSVPESSGDWSLLFENADVVSVNKSGE